MVNKGLFSFFFNVGCKLQEYSHVGTFSCSSSANISFKMSSLQKTHQLDAFKGLSHIDGRFVVHVVGGILNATMEKFISLQYMYPMITSIVRTIAM